MREFVPEIGMSLPQAPKAERRHPARPFSLQKSQKKSPAPAVVSAKAPLAKRQGQTLGAAFAPLNGADHDRLESYAGAIHRGIAEDRDRSDFEREATTDDDYLRSIGFVGRQ